MAAGTLVAASRVFYLVLAVIAVFGLYWLSSHVLAVRRATLHFGADAHLYTLIAKGEILDRVLRFHPVTVGMAVGWMDALEPLRAWFTPQQILKAMFAAVGAVGVLGATAAFQRVVPRGYALLFSAVYAVSFGIWYFASIEESKIVTATLSTMYIAVYLRLREQWTDAGAVLLTAVLLIACLNEIVSGFLVVIPLVDTFMQRGWDWKGGRWILPHALAGPVALLILEVGVSRRLAPVAAEAEGASHFSMLIHYIQESDHGVASLYGFLINWLFFNIAAPTPTAPYMLTPPYGGYFEPSLASFFSSPVSSAVGLLLGLVLLASFWTRNRQPLDDDRSGLVLALLAYSCVRGLFFFLFNPSEPMLFSPAVTLAHLLAISVLFTASAFPGRKAILTAFIFALLAANGVFILGQ
jgi:hypothetical protein